MNRLAPLITRRSRNRWTAPAVHPRPIEVEDVARWLEDAKLFAFGWVAGLVVFGTLLA